MLQEHKSLKGLVCDFPYWRFEINWGGAVNHCCATWLPTVVGNIRETSLFEIIRSEISMKIRASMEAGEFAYCSKELCPYLSQYLSFGKLQPPLVDTAKDGVFNSFTNKRVLIMLNYDRSCNLRCPSCRNELDIYPEENAPPDILAIHQATMRNLRELQAAGFTIHLNVTGAGDAFASPLYYKLLRELEFNDQLFLEIQTNGTLMEERRFTDPMYRMAKFLGVSVDASTKNAYDLVRRGGNFERLVQNLDWIDGAIQAGRFPKLDFYKVNFIVQKDNFREIADFARWILKYKSVNEIWFNLIADWGHLAANDFAERAVWREDHPDHREFLSVVNDPVLADRRVNLGNLSAFATA